MANWNELGPNNTPDTRYASYLNDGPNPGYNGLTGFKQWECYMLIKYGKPNNFGVDSDSEYLIELPMYPESVTESISTNWQTQSVLGRSSPLSAYAGTDLKSVSFNIDLHRDYLTGSYSLSQNDLLQLGGSLSKQSAGKQIESADGPFDTRTWYVSMNKMLQMSCYPQYTDNGLIPPTTYFIFGQMILKGYVKSYSTTWKTPIINSFYGWNSVQIQMDCYPDTIMSARDFILNSSSSSTQNTYNTQFPNESVKSNNVLQRDEMRNRRNFRTGSTLGGQVIDT